jgi:predicted dehydrogenase
MTKHLNRREFLQRSAAASASVAAVGYFTSRAAAESKSPNEKLNIACVGTANRAAANVSGVSGENLVALCDIDDNYLDAALKKFPRAKRYNDFRKMLEKEQKHIDAVVVSTADHVHAPASVMAMRLGKHVYCEKPLTHTVAEARLCAKLAKEN